MVGLISSDRPQPPVKFTLPLPSSIPTVLLTEAEKEDNYGMHWNKLPSRAKLSIKAYETWCTVPINLERGEDYAAPVQSSSMDKTVEVIRAFLGWCYNRQGVDLQDLHLDLYADNYMFVNFLGYLRARGAGHKQQKKQVSVAKKVR